MGLQHIFKWPHCYRPQRSCGQGNIFTPVCQFFQKGGGWWYPTRHWGRPPPRTRHTTPLDQAHHTHPRTRHNTPQTRHTPPDQAHPPGPGTPPTPGKQTPAYCLRAAGTHPTGMHSCFPWEQYQKRHRSIVEALTLMLGLNGPKYYVSPDQYFS